MNKIYKIVWNKTLAQMVVVSEHAKSAGKRSPTTGTVAASTPSQILFTHCIAVLKSLSLSIALVSGTAFAGIANTALPTGAQITHGSANISHNNNTLNIQQNSQNLSSNWNSFNIGKDATVNFNQPNASSIAVNRVLDSNASQIMGKLNANGQVFLLNPNGVIFSKTAQVNVGGIVASTLSMSDSDIAQGKFTLKNQNNNHTGSVENYGSIIAGGGVVALIAPTVKNHGSIHANNGTVHLTAADQVTLQLQDGRLTEYQIDIGTLQGLVENGGAIQADNGAVYLTAQAKNSLSKAVVNHTGIIEANRLEKNAKGEIILLGDMQTGTTTVSGTLKAEGKNGQDGGFIETSAAKIDIQDSAKVSTLSEGGKTGEWLIDPYNVTISHTAQTGNNNSSGTFNPSHNDSVINVNTLQNALSSNNITVTTAGGGTQAGNINVDADVTWNTATALTLRADNDININANITANHNSGKLHLKYGQTTSNTNANYYLNNGAKVNLQAGQNFSTQKGAVAATNYTVITALGAQGSTSKTDLQGIQGGLSSNYVLGADINATATSGWNGGEGFNPIGTLNNEFKGKFDGLGHTISNLSINRPTQNYIGLFGRTSAATIQNIGLMDVDIHGGSNYTGSLAGVIASGSKMYNAYATGAVTGQDYVGGLVGVNSTGTINNAYATGAVTGNQYVGGLVGVNSTGTINNAYATGAVTGNQYVGGLVGLNNGGTISNAYATGAVTGKNYFVGGLVGYNDRGTISHAYATGAVTGTGTSNQSIGGLVGHNNGANAKIENAYATGTVKGNSVVGGLVGYAGAGTINNTYATGTVNGNSVVGGLVGDNNATISNSYWNKDTTGQSTSAGGATGLTTLQMFDQANFVNDFGFGTVWGNSDNQTTPYLLNHGGLNSVFNKNDLPTGASTATNRPDLYNVIQSLAQLQGMNNNLAGRYALGNDVNAAATSTWNKNGNIYNGFSPIGNNTNEFTGKFDGLGHTISNLSIHRPTQYYIGLFGRTSGATIQNVGLIDVDIHGGSQYTGSLAGVVADASKTHNVYATGAVSGRSDVGGLVGLNNGGTISHAYATGAVTGTGSNVGGLAGDNWGTISHAYATGAVTGNQYVGGLVGHNYYQGTISHVYATGAVSGTSNVGGLAGDNWGTISHAYATGAVTGNDDVGGLVGHNWYGQISNSHWDSASTTQLQAVGNTANHAGVSGINENNRYNHTSYSNLGTWSQVGTSNVWVATDSSNNNQWVMIEGQTRPFLWMEHSTDISNVHQLQLMAVDLTKNYNVRNDIDAIATKGDNPSDMWSEKGFSPIGNGANFFTGKFDGLGHTISNLNINRPTQTYIGLFGRTSNATIQNIGLLGGSVTGQDYVGGLVGLNWDGTISHAYATGAVTGNNNVGGFVGTNFQGTIANTYATGAVTGNIIVGGLIGESYGNNTKIENAYATGAVTGNSVVGGLVGRGDISGGNAKISNAYATGAVTGNWYLGGLVGLNSSGTISNGYWDKDSTGQSTSSGSPNENGLTSAEMKQGAKFAFIDADSYEGGKNTVWRIYEGQTNPLLRSFLTQADVGTVADQNKTYNGQVQGLDLTGVDITGLDNTKLLIGQSSSKNVGTYHLGYYSHQQGYDLIGGSADLTIDPATLTYIANSQNRKYGEKNPLFTGSVTGFVNGETLATATTGTTSFSTLATQNSNVGSYAINGSGLTANNGNYVFVQKSGNANALTINKATLTVTADKANKVYGDTTTFTGNEFISTGLQNGETIGSVSLSSTGATNTANVGNYNITASDATGGTFNANNYTIHYDNGQLVVAKRDLTVTADNANKIYGDTSTFTGSEFISTGLQNGETIGSVSLSSTGATNTANVGNYNITASDATGGTFSANNYTISYSNGQLVVSPRALTITANNASKTYGDATAFTGNEFISTGLQNGETIGSVSLSSTGATNTANVGNYNITASDATGGTFNANNYTIHYDNGQLVVAKRDLTVTADNANKIYGDTSTFTGSEFISSGLQNGETIGSVSLSSTGATNTANVGNYNITASDATGGTFNANNYTIHYDNGQLVVAKRDLTVTANNANKIYDGQHYIGGNGVNYNGFVNGEDETVLGGTLAYAGNAQGAKDAGSYDIEVNGLTSTNYEISYDKATLDIDKAKATVTANSDKVTYNGKNQTVTGFSASGLVNGEDASVLTGVITTGGTGKDAGTYTNTASGVDKNYDLTFVDGSLNIGKAQATVTANSLNTIYNGQNQTVTGFTAQGLVTGEDESVLTGVITTGGTGKNAGHYSHTASGTDGNYDLVFIDGALDIDKAKATVTANSDKVTYNGKNQTVTGFTAQGLVTGEDESVLTGVITTGGTGKNAGHYSHTASGTDGNYDLVFIDGALDIDKAKATVTANSDKVTYNGKNQTVTGFTAQGLVTGEDESVLTGVTTTGGTGKNAGHYSHTASGTDNNYDLVFVAGALDIDKAKATVTANSNQVTYNGKNQTVTGFTAQGLVTGEDESVLTGVTTTGGTGKNAGHYSHTASGTDNNYDLVFVDGALDIDKAKATVTANSNQVTYNGKNQTVTGFSANGLVNGEDASVLTGVITTGGTGKNAGHYSHTASGTDDNYDLVFVDGALDIDKAQATVTANSNQVTYNGKNQTVTGFSASGLVNGEDASVLTGVITTGGTGKDAGTYTNTASGTDNNYDLVFVAGALDIDKAKATVTANSNQVTYNGKNQTVTGFSASGLVNGEDESVLTGVSTTGGTGKNAGHYSHTASGTDNNYDLVFIDGALDIDKAKATVTANSDKVTYNGKNQTVTGFTAQGLVTGEDESVLTGVTTTGGTGKNAGHYSHTASGTDNNYDLVFVAGALDIDKAKATVTANSDKVTYNGKDQTVTGFSASGLVDGEDASVLTGVITTGGTGKNAGHYSHTASGTDDNYDLVFVDGALVIHAQPKPIDPQPPVQPNYYPSWANPYQRAIRMQPLTNKANGFEQVEIEIAGQGINLDNIQTLGSN